MLKMKYQQTTMVPCSARCCSSLFLLETEISYVSKEDFSLGTSIKIRRRITILDDDHSNRNVT
jgi:hypothetical protein